MRPTKMVKKKILFFAHYYYPDTASTGQLLKDLAEGMLYEFDVTVICTVPSYEGIITNEYTVHKYYYENINGVKVIRVKVPAFTKVDKVSRIRNLSVYFLRAIYVTLKIEKQDYIFAISQPPIMGGILGICGKWLKKAKLIYCIQDFNPEQIIAVGYFKNRVLLKIMQELDKFSCRHSNLLITVGRDLCQTIEQRFEGKKVPSYTMINNWIDENEIYPLPFENKVVKKFRKKYKIEDKFVIMYSGNIGLYYDLDNLIRLIKKFQGIKASNGRTVEFVFVGAGALLGKLKSYAIEQKMSNVTFIPYQKKENIIYSLNAADVHWCVNAKGIKGVSCPSKFYGIVACQKPVLAVLEYETEIRMIIEETKCGLVSEPEDYTNITKQIQWFIEHADSKQLLQMGRNGYEYLNKHFTRNISVRKYIDAIKAL